MPIDRRHRFWNDRADSARIQDRDDRAEGKRDAEYHRCDPGPVQALSCDPFPVTVDYYSCVYGSRITEDNCKNEWNAESGEIKEICSAYNACDHAKGSQNQHGFLLFHFVPPRVPDLFSPTGSADTRMRFAFI